MKALLKLKAPSVLARVKEVLSAHFISFETVEIETEYTLDSTSESPIVISDHHDRLQDGKSHFTELSNLKTLFVVDSTQTSADAFFRLMEVGVDGIIDTHFSDASLLNALHEISEGMGYICPRFAKSLLEYFQFNKSRTSLLSEKELAVVRLLVKGETYMRIAEMLSMSINTVRFHVKNIYRKHNIHNKTLLSRYFHDLVIDAPIAIKPAYNEV